MPPKQAAERTADGGDGEAVVDLDHLDQYTLGDRAFQAELLQLFRVQLKDQTQALASCQDEAAWKTAVHTLKGVARSVGAVQVAQAAEAMELIRYSDDAERAAVLSRLVSARAAFEAQIDRFL